MSEEQSGTDEDMRPPLGEPVGLVDGPVEQLRIVEALLFAAEAPVSEEALAARLPKGADLRSLLVTLQAFYAPRGVNLVRVAEKWTFRTAEDLGFLLHKETTEERKLSRAALETLAIVAYHQPVTRAEIEEVRGVTVAKGTLDLLLETGWLRIRGRRKVPGRPVTFGTTQAFLEHFGLESIGDLPGLDDLKAAGLLDGRLPPGFKVPMPDDGAGLRDDEEPDDSPELDLSLAPKLGDDPAS
ncbi:SMC-Scp complex subunit ScpB [Phreatobacter sp.]|uniref:SMC-Scp complex subunit ScpB n=1 Tax=Phreatobacter sp. TaxID=1966341 RepID=UPI003F8EC1CF